TLAKADRAARALSWAGRGDGAASVPLARGRGRSLSGGGAACLRKTPYPARLVPLQVLVLRHSVVPASHSRPPRVLAAPPLMGAGVPGRRRAGGHDGERLGGSHPGGRSRGTRARAPHGRATGGHRA